MPEVMFDENVTDTVLRTIASDLRPPEREDFERSFQGPLIESLLVCVEESVEHGVAYLDGDPVALFGVGRDSGLGHQPWMAMTNEASRHPVTVVRLAREWVEDAVDRYGYLMNWVPVDDQPAIDLLEALGFTIRYDVTYSRGGAGYYEFFRRA